jgi:hypothetical protein
VIILRDSGIVNMGACRVLASYCKASRKVPTWAVGKQAIAD